jgi:putative thioredoxin
MNGIPYIFDVTQSGFAALVLENSFNVPVLVDFWAAWCEPCRMLTPTLQRLAEEYQGAFLLAKVNSDQEQALAAQFGVRSLPTVKVFRNGQVVDERVGVQPESVYRDMIDRYRAKPSDQLLARAEAAWRQGNRNQALELLRQALALEPDNIQLKLALAELLLLGGDSDKAGELLHALPLEVRLEPPTSSLLARLEFSEQAKGAPPTVKLEKALQAQPEDCALRRQLAARKVIEGDYEAALEQFLEIMRCDRQFDDEAGRKGLLAIFNILGNDDPRVAVYRRRMSALLH